MGYCAVVSQKLADVLEVLTASAIRVIIGMIQNAAVLILTVVRT